MPSSLERYQRCRTFVTAHNHGRHVSLHRQIAMPVHYPLVLSRAFICGVSRRSRLAQMLA